MKKVIALLFVIIAGIITAILMVRSSSVDHTIHEVTEAFKHQNKEIILENISPDRLQMPFARENLITWLNNRFKEIEERGGVTDIETLAFEENNGRGKVTLRVIYADGSHMDGIYSMIYINRKWYFE